MKKNQILSSWNQHLSKSVVGWWITLAVMFSLAARASAQGAIPPPVIDDFDPNNGPVGTQVSITGENLGTATAVRVNGAAATVQTGFSDTNIVATVPSNATSGHMTVVPPAGSRTTVA